MSIEDGNSPEPRPAAIGIIHCLRMLAEEAESLRLYRTADAIKVAMDACLAETTQDDQTATEREEPVARQPLPRSQYH